MTTTEEVIRLATAAGFLKRQRKDYTLERISRLIDLVRAEENEACAALVDLHFDECEPWICGDDIRSRMKA